MIYKAFGGLCVIYSSKRPEDSEYTGLASKNLSVGMNRVHFYFRHLIL